MDGIIKKILPILTSSSCMAMIAVFALFFFIFAWGNVPGMPDKAGAIGIGGTASGSPMDIENGTALSSDEIEKLIGLIPRATLLKNGGTILYDAGKDQKVNPLFMLGIAEHESNFGQAYANNPSSSFGACKNMFGLDWSAKFVRATKGPTIHSGRSMHTIACFNTWADGVYELAALLRRAYLNPGGTYYIGAGTNDEKALALLHTYSPHSDGNNPDAYKESVFKRMREWCGLLGINPDQPRS